MGNQVIRTIRLSGEDAVNFANSLFRPTREEISLRNEHMNRINENVNIKRTVDGFEAEIADLDLSFLAETPNEAKMNVEVTFKFKTSTAIYYNSQDSLSEGSVLVEKNNDYSSSKSDGLLSWAA